MSNSVCVLSLTCHLQDEVAECGQWLGPQTPLSGHKNRNAPPRTTTTSRLRTTIVIPEIYQRFARRLLLFCARFPGVPTLLKLRLRLFQGRPNGPSASSDR